MKKSTLAWSIALAAVLVGSATFARVATATDDTATTSKLQKIANCEVITGNVDKRITNFENQKAKHVTGYKKTQAKIVALVDKMETQGYDVAQLRIDLVTYDQKITKFGTDFDTYITDLTQTKEFTCGRSSGEFKAKLAIAREQLKIVHDDAVAIRTYWSQTLKPEIEALKVISIVTPESTVEGGTNQ